MLATICCKRELKSSNDRRKLRERLLQEPRLGEEVTATGD